jgi:hypothetical protein
MVPVAATEMSKTCPFFCGDGRVWPTIRSFAVSERECAAQGSFSLFAVNQLFCLRLLPSGR